MKHTVNLPNWLKASTVNDAPSQPAWRLAAAKQYWQAFLAQGLPTRQHERWRYADLAFLNKHDFSTPSQVNAEKLEDTIHQYRLHYGDSILLVLINGCFMPTLSDLTKLPEQVIACSWQQALREHTALIPQHHQSVVDAKRYPFVALNTALGSDGLFFYVPAQTTIPAAVHVLCLSMEQTTFVTYPQHTIILGEQSEVTWLEEHFSQLDQTYLTNQVTQLIVEKNAKLNYYKIQAEGREAAHLAHTFVQQAANSQTRFTHFSTGAAVARDELQVTLQGSGADCRTAGFYHTRADNQYIDHHVDICHAASHTQSDMLYKGILEQRSRAVFNGRLLVEKDAQKIVAYQANHHLLLSANAEAYAKPELEIYADEVKCKHGATTGCLDQDALFYLRSRGIEHDEALSLLLHAFAEEVTQRINHVGIKARIQEILC
ncbi:MAG TPA: Fe-S cluster assembly protein SufD [Gammaproteobacteria bacterium]|jgi:Fe-S cluster assembly protein SufD|nr:Fe-S cluster assembly protein SufD [Gammaproteobacteria bacterium]